MCLRYIELTGCKASLAMPNYSDVMPREVLSDMHKKWGKQMRAFIGEVPDFPICCMRPSKRRQKSNCCCNR